MYPIFTLARLRAKKRALLYGIISLLIINSMLLQPLAAIAEVQRPAYLLRTAAAEPPTSLESASQKPANEVKARPPQSTAMRRTAAQVAPTPSGALRGYPLNHVLDAADVTIGTPPPNYNFESPASGGIAPPSNYDFSILPYPVGTPPTNYNFESGTFSNWTTAGTVSIQSDATHGYWAQLGGSGKIISEPFTVDSSAQRISFTAYHGGSAAFRAYIHSGAGYATRTEIANYYCNNCGWVDYQIDPTAYLGQSIKIEFLRFGATVGIDEIQMGVILPDYTVAGAVKRLESNGNAYAWLDGNNATITSAPFTIGTGVQQLTLLLSGLSNKSDQYRVQLLSDATYSTVTQLDAATVSDSWQPFSYNVSAWQGQTVKLRIASTYLLGTIGVDEIGIQSVPFAGWSVAGEAQMIEDGSGNHYLSTSGTIISDPFTIAPEAQHLTLSQRINSGTIPRFEVSLLTGSALDVPTQVTQFYGTTDWSTTLLSVSEFAGQTVRLKLSVPYGTMEFDNIGIGKIVLHGWDVYGLDRSLNGAIVSGNDAHGSYIQPASATKFTRLRSQPIATGIIDTPNVDRKFFAVSYEIGMQTANSIRVYWHDGQSQSQVFADAADTPTGYRTRYFGVPDTLSPTGRFVVSLSGGGKLYSIADNIARQHLAEPFSYKTGIKIDTSTGSFGYDALDLRMDDLLPLVFARYYNGHSDRPGVLGYGWSHSYETRLELAVGYGYDHAGVIFGSGKEVFFLFTGSSNTFIPADARVHDQLVRNIDGTYTYTAKGAAETPYATDDQCSLIGLRNLRLRPQNLTYHFDSSGALLSIRDHNNVTVSLNYVNGRLATIVAQSGATFTLNYNEAGKLANVQSSWAGSVTYGYDNAGDLTAVTRPNQGVEGYKYWDHRLSEILDANGNVLIHNNIDGYQRVGSQTDAHNQRLELYYDSPSAGVTTVKSPEGGFHYFYYDQHHRTTDWVSPTGEITSYLYDGVGNLQKVIDGGFGQWNFSYDNNANLLGLADPQGDPLLISYNPEHLPTTITDAKGNVTTLLYTATGNIDQLTSGGEVTDFEYTPLGQLQSVTTPWLREAYTYYPLDGTLKAGKIWTRSVGPIGGEKIWTYTYELLVHELTVLGRKEHVTDPNGHTFTTVYNVANQIVALRDHTGAQQEFLYDPIGHLLMAQDELGRRTYWDYNDVGLVEKKIDPEGFATFYAYDANRNMTAMTDPNGLVTSYQYDDSNRLKKTTLPGNRVTEYWYDGCGRVTTQQNPRGQITSYAYDLAGQLITMTMPLNAVYQFEYDGNGNLQKTIDPLQTVTEQTYDALNRPQTIKDGAGFITEYQYDQANREIRVINPRGETTTYRYNLLGQMTTVLNPLQQTTAFAYDGIGNRVAITDTLGYAERFAYDAVDRPAYYTNKAGRRTQFVYDAAGQLKQIVEPTAQATRVTHFDYWGRGLLKNVTNALGQPPTQYVYDAGGRLTNIWEPDGKGTKYHYYPDSGLLEKVLDRIDKATHYEYDPMGNVTAVIDPLGRRATYEYDEMNRLKKAAAPNSPPTEYKYYANGKLKELWTPAQRPTYYAYDGRGLVTSVTDAFGRAMNYAYDEAGRLKTVTDRRQNAPYILEYLYDSGGRLTDMRGAAAFDNVGVHYTYDGANRLESVTDPNGLTTSYTYNALDQVRTATQPISRTTTYTYDEYNRLWVTEDPRGVEVTYGYDVLDRVKQVNYPGGQNTFEYDTLGRLDWYSDPTGLTDYGYDDASRVNQIMTAQGTVGYGYYDDGQRSAMTLDAGAPDARTINYTYNDKGQLWTIGDWQGRTNTLTYDADGNLAGITRYNNVNTAYNYDSAGRLDHLNHSSPAGTLAWFDYTLDEMGNRTALDSHLGHEDYGIDGLNRLYAANSPGGNESYQYHPNGDRRNAQGGAENYSYNAGGQLEARNAPMLADSLLFTYDANGNVTTATDGHQQIDSYNWDWANHLTSATVDGKAINYTYDAMGVRVSATVSGTTQNLLWDRMAELPLLVDDGSQSYLHGAGPLAQIDATGTRYDLLADGLGSVRNLIDGSGAVVGAADYSMFGNYRNQTGVTSRFGFTGEYYAQETGMWHLRARDLHPSLGRFLSADPVQPNAPGTQGYNLYAYVANNPTTWVDPSGYTLEPAQGGDQALLGMMYAIHGGLVGIFECALDEECRGAQALMTALGSEGANFMTWTAENLQQALFGTYPHQPTPVDPGLLVLSLGLSNTPIWGDLYDLYTGVTGYDPLTGQSLAGWERLANLAGALPIFGISGANIRQGVHAAEALIHNGDELAQVVGAVGKSCSFEEETPVATDEGAIPIREIDVGDRVLAWNEALGETGYYTVTATMAHWDPVVVHLTVDGETIETTPEHPFYAVTSAPWLSVGETEGRWTLAGALKAGDQIQQADGTTGVVETVLFEATEQLMYNLTVADAHTYTVGDGEWVVHNDCNPLTRRLTLETDRKAAELIRTLSRRQRGPVLTGVAHPALDQIYFGINHTESPRNLPKVLQELDTSYTNAQRSLARVQAGKPGTHSEIYALTDAIYALEAKIEREVELHELGEFILTNRYLHAPIIHLIDRCDHCRHLTAGVITIGHK